MSRPPNNTQREPNLESMYSRGVIDFVHQGYPLNAPYPYPCNEEGFVSPSVYTQAGFPGYQHTSQLHQLSMAPPGYPPSQQISMGSPYHVYTDPMVPAQSIQAQPHLKVENSTDIQERINAKIDSIINAHKTETLSSQINQLNTKIEMLTEMQKTKAPHQLNEPYQRSRLSSDAYDRDTMHRLSRLSEESMASSKKLSSDISDSQITRQLRKLAADSAKRANERSTSRGSDIPDW